MSTKDYLKSDHDPTDKGLWFLPLGGAGEIGMNLNLYCCDGNWIIVDLGVSFNDYRMPGVEIILPDPMFIEERRDSLLGIVLTHAHEDHIGAVAYLWEKLRCPIYASPFTACFLRHKLSDIGKIDEIKIIEVNVSGKLTVGPFDIEFINLTHSIPEPNGLGISTSYGNILHTGDWKFDDNPLVGEVSDKKKLKGFGDKGVLALVGDSTNALTAGKSGSENEVRKTLLEIVNAAEGKVIVSCFASNLARIKSIIDAAHKNNREVALVGRSLWRIVKVARETGYLDESINLYEAEELSCLTSKNLLYICTGSQGEPRAALTRIAEGKHPDISLSEEDIVVFSSRIIPGNEKPIFALYNKLARLDVKIITSKTNMVHVSGHPAQEELNEMYKLIKPEISIPVHGEQIHLKSHLKIAQNCKVPNCILVENGMLTLLAPGVPGVKDQVFYGRMSWEGNRALPYQGTVLKERKKIHYNGAIFITIVIQKKPILLKDLKISVISLPLQADENEISNLESNIFNHLLSCGKEFILDDKNIVYNIKRLIKKKFYEYKIRPLVKLHIFRD
ncbi:MAG: ribonuclease J [Pseudomonadota bacterium]|nr:ribonuclease J [Pseudomonadota bacterium]